MKVWKKQKKRTCSCYNCGYEIQISPDSVKEKTFEGMIPTIFEHGEDQPVIATYVECPVCGERLLKQLDTPETMEMAEKGVKLELLQKRGKKLSDKQKNRLKSIEIMLSNTRKKLKTQYWDEIYQSLNQYEDEKTGMVDQMPESGFVGVPLRPDNSAGRTDEHEISE